MGYWEQRRVLVTGGGSFIGSHLVEALLARGAHVRAADDFSSGRRENLLAARDHVEVREVRGYLGGLLTERPAPEGWQVPAGLAGRPR